MKIKRSKLQLFWKSDSCDKTQKYKVKCTQYNNCIIKVFVEKEKYKPIDPKQKYCIHCKKRVYWNNENMIRTCLECGEMQCFCGVCYYKGERNE